MNDTLTNDTVEIPITGLSDFLSPILLLLLFSFSKYTMESSNLGSPFMHVLLQ